MQITLIYPPRIVEPHTVSLIKVLPYGLGTLASFLRKNDITVDLSDIDILLKNSSFPHPKSQRLLQDLHAFHYQQTHATHYSGILDKTGDLLAAKLLDLTNIGKASKLVGISIVSYLQIFPALLLAEKIKKEYKIPVIIGGPFVTLFAHLFFSKYHFIDYAVIGEGEVPLLKLIHSINGKEKLEDIPSLWYRNESGAVFTGRAFYDIENQTCPDFDGLPLESYKIFPQNDTITIPYSLSRGCVSDCKFCAYKNVDGLWQAKSVKKVIENIISLKDKYQTSRFFFQDMNFNVSNKYVEDICDALIDSGLDIRWEVMAQLKGLDKALLTKIKKAGCFRLIWGLESGSSRILHMMDKIDVAIEEKLRILKNAKEAGIDNALLFIIKYPYESADDLRKTALLIKDNAEIIDEVWINLFALSYGMSIFNNPEKARINIKENPSTFLTHSYGFEEIDREQTPGLKKELRYWRQKVLDYSLIYIKYKKCGFPYNLLLRLFGLKVLRYFSRRLI